MMGKHQGFTLIELIMVMVLITILSAFAIGLFSSPSSYQPATLYQMWLNQLRFSQRQAFNKAQPNFPLIVSITRNSSDWIFSYSQNGNTLDVYEFEHNDVELLISNVDFLSACSALSSATYPITLRFDGYAERVDNSNNAINTNQRFCFQGRQDLNICLAPSGYAYGGTCEN